MRHIFLLLCVILLASAEFITFNYGSRANRLYIPQGYNKDNKYPLFVMLHGCTQNPDDFAAGTKMNAVADKHGLIVLYPLQPSSANQNKCWNWFEPAHQSRGSGEPAFIAGATDAVAKAYSVDSSKVFVAGLSAGGAMTSIMGGCYPDVYSGLGIGAGLEYKAATSTIAALQAMRDGGPAPAKQGEAAWKAIQPYFKKPFKTLVVQGTSDYTVYSINGNNSIIQWMTTASLALAPVKVPVTPTSTRQDLVPGGRTYSQMEYSAEGYGVLGRFILVQGMAHAWSGGSTAGTYTDPKGPDASEIMVEYFLSGSTPEPTPVTPSPVAPTPTVPPTPTVAPTPTVGPTPVAPTPVVPTPTTPHVNIAAIPEETGFVGLTVSDGSSAQQCKTGDKGMYNYNTFFTILSFDTGLIPAGVTVTSASLSLTVKSKSGTISVVTADIKSGNFGSSPSLVQSDYNAHADVYDLLSWDPSTESSVDIPASALKYLNTAGRTHFRIKAVTSPSFGANTYFFDCDWGTTTPPTLTVNYQQ